MVLEFAVEEGWIKQEQFDHVYKLADEIGAMLWTEVESLNKKVENGA